MSYDQSNRNKPTLAYVVMDEEAQCQTASYDIFTCAMITQLVIRLVTFAMASICIVVCIECNLSITVMKIVFHISMEIEVIALIYMCWHLTKVCTVLNIITIICTMLIIIMLGRLTFDLQNNHWDHIELLIAYEIIMFVAVVATYAIIMIHKQQALDIADEVAEYAFVLLFKFVAIMIIVGDCDSDKILAGAMMEIASFIVMMIWAILRPFQRKLPTFKVSIRLMFAMLSFGLCCVCVWKPCWTYTSYVCVAYTFNIILEISSRVMLC